MKCQIIVLLLIYSLFCSCKGSSDVILGTVDLGDSKLALTQEADSLNVPWDLEYDKKHDCIIFSEIAGNVKKLDLETKQVSLVKKIPGVFQQRTTGLLGMVLYQPPNNTNYLFLSFTTKQNGKIYSNLYRYIYTADSKLESPKLLLQIPGNTGHNGSRVIVGPDEKIYWATGDAASDHFAQDSTSLNGKILRINIDGSIPADNPIKHSYVYAWGFRNMQGLTKSPNGTIYTSEHGDAIEDEINLINPMKNYGWPLIEGTHPPQNKIDSVKLLAFTAPIKSWTPVIAPSGLAYYGNSKIPEWENSLILATLKSQSLRILKLSANGQAIVDEYTLFKDQLGRLRSVVTAPNGDIYFCSSNRDWNPQKGFPKPNDDRIYRLRKTDEISGKIIRPVKTEAVAVSDGSISGQKLYVSYCSSCHKEDGKGVPGTFPPLKNSKTVAGPPEPLIGIVLHGLKNKTINGVKYDAEMPAFSFLKAEEATAIINYIRTNFNNNSNTITTGQLKQIK